MTQQWMLRGIGVAMALSAPLCLLAQETPAAKPATPAADPSALLKAIPADATAFLAIRSLSQLDQDIQDSAKALNLPPGTIPSLIQWVKGSLNLGQGFNEEGSMAVVVLNTAQVTKTEELENRIALFFAANDPKALAVAMGGEKDGEVSKVTFADEPAFAAPKGDFLVVAKDEAALKEAVQAKGGGLVKTMTAERAKAYTEQDIFGWGNFRGISKELRQSIREELKSEMGPQSPIESLMGSLDQLEKMIEQGESVAVGLSVDPKNGITGNFYLSMRPDTELGKQMAGMEAVKGSLLTGLPGEPFVFAMGSTASPDTERQLKQMLDVVLSEENVGEKVDKDKLAQVRDGLVHLLSSVQQMSLAIYPLPVEDAKGMVNATLVAKVRDADAWKQEAKKLFTVGKDLIVEAAKQGGEPEEQVKQFADAVQWKENAETIGGARVDHLSLDIAKIPDVGEEDADQAKKVLGPEGVLIRIGALGKDKVLVVFGGGAGRFDATAKLAAAGEAPLSGRADVKKVADRLPAGPKLLEGYLNVDTLISLVMDISSEVGGGIMFPIALRNAAPVAFTSVKIGETAQQTEVLIPMELIRSVADIVRPMLQMGIGGGPQPGDSDEPEPPGGPGLQ